MKTPKNGIEKLEIIIIDDKDATIIAQSIQDELVQRSLDVLVTPFYEVQKAIEYLDKKRWRYVKTMLVDFELLDPINEAVVQEPTGVELVDLIKDRNPFIDVYGISIKDPSAPENIEDSEIREFRLSVINFLSKDHLIDKKTVGIELQRFFINPLENREKTPFFTAMKGYVNAGSNSWHVPGHNKGLTLSKSVYGQEFYDFFGQNAFLADHDVPKKFGSIFNLNNSEDSVIHQMQKMVSGTFGVKETAFVTNGNSASNNIVMMSVLKPGDEVLVSRSNHKSIHYAIVMTGARPTYLNSVFSQKYEMLAPPSILDIEEKLKAKPKGFYRLLVITGCTYEGLVMDIKRVNNLCIKYGTELFVDEAWYGYSYFHPKYRPTSATLQKVPYVTQSAHKMLAAFRQSAFIHLNSDRLDEVFFKDVYNTFTSTSPQYQLVASMDVAAMQMRMEGFELIDKALERAELFKKDFEKAMPKYIKMITPEDLAIEFKSLGFDFKEEGIFCDPLKISFDISALGINVKEAFDFISTKAGVDLVKYTRNCIQILFTIGTAFDKDKTWELVTTLIRLEDKKKDNVKPLAAAELRLDEFKYNGRLPRDFFYGQRELVNMRDAIGRYSATMVTPYPPGIPVLLPGEPVTAQHIDYIEQTMKHNSIHGLIDGQIYVSK